MRFTRVALVGGAMFAALFVPRQLAAQVVDGSGTANVVPRWIDSNTLGNSNISIPGGVVTVTGKNGTVTTPSAPTALSVTGGSGATITEGGLVTTGTGGGPSGGGLWMAAGRGGNLFATNGRAYGGTGASIQVSGGTGGYCRQIGTRCYFTGGNGGSIIIQPGNPGSGQYLGHPGTVLLLGNIAIGVSNSSQTFAVRVGGTTLADEWTIRSSRRFKTNIQPLQDALSRIEALQGVSYERTIDGKHEIGVVAEDVDRVVPEVVAHDPETHQVEGVDYSRLVALLIEAVKAQQAEIEGLKSQMAQLTPNAAR